MGQGGVADAASVDTLVLEGRNLRARAGAEKERESETETDRQTETETKRDRERHPGAPWSLGGSAVERTRHTQDSHGQFLALTFRQPCDVLD